MDYPINNFNFGGLMECKNNIYKYVAILTNINTEKIIIIPFGKINETHYRDMTGLNTYSHLDSNNNEQRRDFILKNKFLIKGGYYNSIYFEMKYL